MTTQHRVGGLLLALALCLSGGCAQTQIELDGPAYDSLLSLTSDEEVIVVEGTFRGAPERVTERDLGATFEYEDEQGLDLDLWQFEVTSTVVGEPRLVDGSISVTQIVLPDRGTGGKDEHDSSVTPVYTAQADRRMLLFLRPYPDSGAYAVLGLGVGSFEVAEDGAISAPDGAPDTLVREVRDLATVDAVAARVTELSSSS